MGLHLWGTHVHGLPRSYMRNRAVYAIEGPVLIVKGVKILDVGGGEGDICSMTAVISIFGEMDGHVSHRRY